VWLCQISLTRVLTSSSVMAKKNGAAGYQKSYAPQVTNRRWRRDVESLPRTVSPVNSKVTSSLDALRDAWVLLLEPFPWEWFCTLTFMRGEDDPLIHPERARKAFRLWIADVNKVVYGGNWRRKCRGVRWCVALEYTKRDTIHFHALVADVGSARCYEAWELWYKLRGHGCARIEPVRSSAACRNYCSKYVVKGGELELGGPESYRVSQLRRHIERSPLYSQPKTQDVEIAWCAGGRLRPDEYLQLKEASTVMPPLA